MKRQLFIFGTLLVAMSPSSGHAVAGPYPTIVTMPAQAIFAPPGFDDNDNAELVIHGFLPNTCYRAASPRYSVDTERHQILVSMQALYYSGSFCADVVIPVTQTISLGVLPATTYRIVEVLRNGQFQSRGILPVAVATGPAPDDHLYAPVDQAFVEGKGPETTLTLSGTFYSDCMYLQDVKVMYRTPHVIEVLPMAAYRPGSVCSPKKVPFETRVALPPADPGYTLIHIRSMNGESLNQVQEF